MRKLILRNHQSPGDIVMLTAAVRDLKRALGGGGGGGCADAVPGAVGEQPAPDAAGGRGGGRGGDRVLVSAHSPEQYGAVAFHPRVHAVSGGDAGGGGGAGGVQGGHPPFARKERVDVAGAGGDAGAGALLDRGRGREV